MTDGHTFAILESLSRLKIGVAYCIYCTVFSLKIYLPVWALMTTAATATSRKQDNSFISNILTFLK